jgi:hypothetical protein
MGTPLADALKAFHEALGRHRSGTADLAAKHKAKILSSFLSIRKEFFPCVGTGGGSASRLRPTAACHPAPRNPRLTPRPPLHLPSYLQRHACLWL